MKRFFSHLLGVLGVAAVGCGGVGTSSKAADAQQTCEDYWADIQGIGSRSVEYGTYVEALNKLYYLGAEGPLHWALSHLDHPAYQAREAVAGFVGEYASARPLSEPEKLVILEKLEAVINRPIEKDAVEVQAVDAAIAAVAKIDHPRRIEILCDVIFTEDPYFIGDIQWNAVDYFGGLVGENFSEADDPVAAAQAWIQNSGAGKEAH